MLLQSDVRIENQLLKTNSTKAYASAVIAASALILAALGYMPIINAVLFIPFTILVLFLQRVRRENLLALTAILIPTILLGFFIAIYRPSEFQYPLIWHVDELYEGGKVFNLTANLSKAIGGYILIIWFAKSMMGARQNSNTINLQQSSIVVVLAMLSVLLVANLFFGVNWQPKFSEGIFYFIVINLFLTVASEEAFFRLLIHDHVATYFKNGVYGEATGITITTLLFALSHSSAYGPAFLLYAFAGFAYALTYSKTKSLVACITVHFGVNILQFIFLEYPI